MRSYQDMTGSLDVDIDNLEPNKPLQQTAGLVGFS
jgi:hypothetical protein